MNIGSTKPAGTLAARVIRGADEPTIQIPYAGVWEENPTLDLGQILRDGAPRRGLDPEVLDWRKANAPHLWTGLRDVLALKAIPRRLRRPTIFGVLYARILRADGGIVPLGLASLNVVTTVGVGYIVDAFQNLVEPEDMKYHGIGTGSTAEAVGDTALVTELTTEYNPDNTRATGSLTEGASANIFRTVGTNTVDAVAGIQEHGILSQAATGGGVLLDRSVFAVINLTGGDSLETTYDLTVTAGG